MTEIITVPHETLRAKTKPVPEVDKKVLNLISDMLQALTRQKDPEGVGIAAPQVGSSLQIFILRPITHLGRKSAPQVFINPQIINLSRAQTTPRSRNSMLEGCLSIPHYYGGVTRSKSVTVTYKTIEPLTPKSLLLSPPRIIERTQTFTDFPAQIVQHEIDHLNGVLFIDRVLEQNGQLYQIKGNDWKRVQI